MAIPALDAGCGTGRWLIPFLEAGLDVDGVDVSPDMLALCREKGISKGMSPSLYQQAVHALDLPRAYQTIVACGILGIGVEAGGFHDPTAFLEHLRPGGLLLLDHHRPRI